MRYKEEFTRKVLSNVDIVNVVSQYTQVDMQEGVAIANCPFHNDKNQSLVIYLDKQSFHCFDCGLNGNAAVFVAECEHISFNDAIAKLAKIAKITPTEQDIDKRTNVVLKMNVYAAYKDAAEYFVSRLKTEEGQVAVDYMKNNRELTDETIAKFGLGYSPAAGAELYKYLSAKGHSDDVLLESGLVKDSGSGKYDMFRGRMMVPIIDEQNRVIAFGGRSLSDDIKPKYLNSPDSCIFDKGSVLYGIHDVKGATKQFFILCEGYMDVIALHQAGFRNSVAALGTAFRQSHIPLLSKYTNNVVLSFDGDEAGQKATMRAIKALETSNIGVGVLFMNPYKDPDEFIKAIGKEEYQLRIKRMMPNTNYQLMVLQQSFDMDNPEEREQFLKQAVDLVIKQEDRKKRMKEPNERQR